MIQEDQEKEKSQNLKNSKNTESNPTDKITAESESNAGKNGTTEQDEVKDRLLRLAAEFDNYKKRVAKESEDIKALSKADLLKKIIPVLDEFELAIDALASSNNDDHMKKGTELIYSNLLGALRSEGLSEIQTGGIYDPYKHDIIMTRESKSKPGTIVEVVRKGYMFNGILVRPASVIVAKEISETKKDNDTKTK